MKTLLITSLLLFDIVSGFAQSKKSPGKPLYPDGNIPFSKVDASSLDEYSLPKLYRRNLEDGGSKDIVFLVIPGGGYAHVAIDHEGIDVAERLNKEGYSAYALFYRVPKDSLMSDREYVPLQDALAAVQTIRNEHPEKKVAVIGFSAGGHLAACLSNYRATTAPVTYDKQLPAVEYTILAYPVITMQSNFTHDGSKVNLIGANAAPEHV